MLDEFAYMVGIDSLSLLAIFTICAVCAFIVSQFLDLIAVIVTSYVVIFAAGFGANLLARFYRVVVTGDKNLDTVLFTTGGLVALLVSITLGLQIIYFIFGANIDHLLRRGRDEGVA